MKATKKQLSQYVGKITDKNNEELYDSDVIEFLKDFDNPAKVLALAKELSLTLGEALDLNETNYDIITHGRSEYLVLTDSEADEKQYEIIDNYVDECVIPELPEFTKPYFNKEAFIEDAKVDGRGHTLATYDGNEIESEVEDDQIYYIYRTN